MWPNPQETADLVKFTEEILNGKLHFLCSGLTIIIKNNNNNFRITIRRTSRFYPKKGKNETINNKLE